MSTFNCTQIPFFLKGEKVAGGPMSCDWFTQGMITIRGILPQCPHLHFRKYH